MGDTVTIPRSEYEELKRKAAMADNRSRGNSKAGKASAAKLTPEQRRARAKKAVEARIKKYGQGRRTS